MKVIFNVSSEETQEVAVFSDALTSLITALKLTLILWGDNSSFSNAVRSKFLFTTSILQYDTLATLRNTHHTAVTISFQQFPPNEPPSFTLSYKTRVLLITNEEDPGVKNYISWLEKWMGHNGIRLLWFNFADRNLIINTWREHESMFEQINYDDAEELFTVHTANLRIPNFQGRKILVAVIDYGVFSSLELEEDNYTGKQPRGTVDGFEALLFEKYVIRLTNLTPIYRKSNNYGVWLEKNRTFSQGAQRDLIQRKTDVLIAGIFYKEGLSGLVQMTYPRDCVCVRYLVPRPKLTISRWTLLNVFSGMVWSTVGASFLVYSAITAAMATIIREPALENYRKIPDCLMNMFYHLLQMRSPARSEYVGCFMPLLLAWGWFGFLWSTVYSCQLAATLTIPSYSEKIQTEAQFVKNGYFWGTQVQEEDWSLYFDLSQTTTRQWVENYYEIEKTGDRARKMKKGRYVIVGFSYGNVFFAREDVKSLENLTNGYEVGEHCRVCKYIGIMFPPGSPYAEATNLIYGRLISAGILQKDEYDMMLNRASMNRFIPKNVFTLTKDSSEQSAFSHLPLSVFYIGLYALLIGHGVATATFLWEFAKNKRKRKKKNLRIRVDNRLDFHKFCKLQRVPKRKHHFWLD